MTTRIEAASVHDGLLAVDVLLNGTVWAFLIVDPGASRCTLSASFVGAHPELGLTATVGTLSAGVAGHTETVSSSVFTLQSVEVGSVARNSIDFVVMALPPQAMIDGVIGVNFLRPYRITFDFIEEWVEFDDRS